MPLQTRNQAAGWLLRVTDLLVLAILFIAPLCMGGRHPLGRLVYVVLVVAIMVCAMARRALQPTTKWQWHSSQLLFLLGCGLVALQLTSLPLQIEKAADLASSTFRHEVLTDTSLSFAGVSPRSTYAPAATQQGLAMLIAHGCLLAFLIQRMETTADVRTYLKWVALAGVWLAVVGLLQYLMGNGRFLWVYHNPFRDASSVVRGPYYNENHFAHQLALSIGPLLAWACAAGVERGRRECGFTRSRSSDPWQRFLLATGAGVILFAALMSRSKGGLLVVGWVGIWFLVGQIRLRRDARSLVAPALVVIVVLFALCLHGWQHVSAEVRSLASGSLDEWDAHRGRRLLWQAALACWRDAPLFGNGVGTFRELFPRYYPQPRQFDYSYAESGYLHVLAETGAVGFLLTALAVAFLVLVIRRILCHVPDFDRPAEPTAHRTDPLGLSWRVAIAAGISASLLHAVFDFVWFIPACFAVTLVLVAAALRVALLESGPTVWRFRSFSPGATNYVIAASLFVFLGWQLTRLLLPSATGAILWDRYLVLQNDIEAAQQDVQHSAGRLPKVEWSDRLEDAQAMRRQLIGVVQTDPHHWRARVRLAAVNLRIFEQLQSEAENPLSLAQIRDASLTSSFTSQAAQDKWLAAVLNERRGLLDESLLHVRTAISLCPLVGEAYVQLAELEFLDLSARSSPSSLVDKALLVRPYDSKVLFVAGREAALRGDLDQALVHWKSAYRRSPDLRPSVMQLLAPQTTPEWFVTTFELTLAEIRELIQFYRSAQLVSQADQLGELHLAKLEARQQQVGVVISAVDWQDGYSTATELNQSSRAVWCARQAVAADPTNYAMRRRLGLELLSQQEYDEAIENLRWCCDQRPYDESAQAKLREARAFSAGTR